MRESYLVTFHKIIAQSNIPLKGVDFQSLALAGVDLRIVFSMARVVQDRTFSLMEHQHCCKAQTFYIITLCSLCTLRMSWI